MNKAILLIRDESSPTGWRDIPAIRGLSAYQVWLNQPSNAGKTEQDFLNSLVGSIEEGTVVFAVSASRTNIASDEKVKITFGKIAKWFSDLKALAFKDKVDWTMDINNRPTSLPASDVSAWAKQPTKPSYSYSEIIDKPTIPAAQVQPDWNATTGLGAIKNKPVSLPASDVPSWAKSVNKPTYTASEVGAAAKTIHKTTALAVASWSQAGDWYIYKVTDTSLVDNTELRITGASRADLELMQEAEFNPLPDTVVGSFTIYAKKKPSAVININYSISF